jgi:MoxR-like ATPase
MKSWAWQSGSNSTEEIQAVMAETTAHPLAHMVPSASYRSRYISRQIDGVNDIALLRKACIDGDDVLIEGPTGPGKTALVQAYAATYNKPLVLVSGQAQTDVRSFIGGWNPLPTGGFDFVPADFLLAVLHGGVGYYDEINLAPHRINAFLHSLLDDRRGVSISEAAGSSFPTYVEAHSDFQLLATMNPAKYRGARELSEALSDRFSHHVEFDYDPDIERKLVVSGTLVELATGIRERIAVGDLVTPLSTRTLIDFERFALDPELGWDYAVANLTRKFKGEERTIVREVLDLHKHGLRSDLFGDVDPEPDTIIDDEDEELF